MTTAELRAESIEGDVAAAHWLARSARAVGEAS